ncbi:hypothetical protein C4579_00420 [Candidatus Microgenomates bacterium]|nr:MAG: hypothetical protein C4579_00420 [Candidatus Microgenomates bacterium]
MDKPVQRAIDNLELHIRHARNLLKSTEEVKISQLIESHANMHSVLHEHAAAYAIDSSAFIYSLLRLPRCIFDTEEIILGQSFTVFKNNGFASVDNWKQVEAVGRRRKMAFDGKKTLAVYIGSVSDVDDLVTLLTAFQIEWNKLHEALAKQKNKDIAKLLSESDIDRLKTILGEQYDTLLKKLVGKKMSFVVRLISGSYVEYMRSTQYWWNHVVDTVEPLKINERPIYFVSSNTHSLINLVTKTAVKQKDAIIDFLKDEHHADLLTVWEEIMASKSDATEEFFLNYVAKKYAREHPEFNKLQEKDLRSLGIAHVRPHHFLDISVQVLELKHFAKITPSLIVGLDLAKLKQSQALIVNIDYPLGWSAYQILTEVAQNVDIIRGVYIMGKAAVLTGEIGDVMLPGTVYDLHTKNEYVFNNAITTIDMKKVYKTGSVFNNQKALTVKGTFFENQQFINYWYKQGYATIEMEAGPYLNAVYECVAYNRYLENQHVSLTNVPFELGMAHYASDTPNSKAKNLGARNLSYEGVESTYGITQVILQKIIERELSFLN